MMSGRDTILARIREALSRPTEDTFLHSRQGHRQDFAPFMPPGGDTLQERISRFREYSEKLRTSFHVVPSLDAAAQVVKQLAADGAWTRVGAHHNPLVDAVTAALELPVVNTSEPYDADDLEACDAGLSACECLIAQTGGVAVSATTCGGRALSVLPPHHVVIAHADQMVSDLSSALRYLQARPETMASSMLSIITGPSRTGDIERILVLGAHGPKQLTVVLVAPEGSP